MPVVVSISQPAAGALLAIGVSYQVIGTIHTSGPDGPLGIDGITASGPGLGAVRLTPQGRGRYRFVAHGTPQAAGIFTISVGVVTDTGGRGTKTVTVSAGFMYSPIAPHVLVDVSPNGLLASVFESLVAPKLQSALMPLSQLLPAPLALVGPEHSSVGTTLRIGFWMLSSGVTTLTPPLFSLLPPGPPASAFARLPPGAVGPSFQGLLTPTTTPPPEGSFDGPFAFGISVSTEALQTLAAALLPQVRAAAAREGAMVDSISVTCNATNMVVTTVRGASNGVSFTLTITEVLSTVAVGTPSGQMVPSVTGTARVDVALPAWTILLSAIGGALGLTALFVATEVVKGGVGANATRALSVANASISGIPQLVSFKVHPVQVPIFGRLLFGGLFPALIPSWTSLRVTPAGIVGTGTAIVRSRSSADVSLTISGPTTLLQTEPEALLAEYDVAWRGIVPDPGTFTLRVLGPRGTTVFSTIVALTNTGRSSVVVEFPMPTRPAAVRGFSLAVDATETSEGDHATTLVAPAARLAVSIRSRRGR